MGFSVRGILGNPCSRRRAPGGDNGRGRRWAVRGRRRTPPWGSGCRRATTSRPGITLLHPRQVQSPLTNIDHGSRAPVRSELMNIRGYFSRTRPGQPASIEVAGPDPAWPRQYDVLAGRILLDATPGQRVRDPGGPPGGATPGARRPWLRRRGAIWINICRTWRSTRYISDVVMASIVSATPARPARNEPQVSRCNPVRAPHGGQHRVAELHVFPGVDLGPVDLGLSARTSRQLGNGPLRAVDHTHRRQHDRHLLRDRDPGHRDDVAGEQLVVDRRDRAHLVRLVVDDEERGVPRREQRVAERFTDGLVRGIHRFFLSGRTSTRAGNSAASTAL